MARIKTVMTERALVEANGNYHKIQAAKAFIRSF